MTAYALNILDLLFTLHALCHGAVEGNPLMRDVPTMVFYKTVVVGALLWWLRSRREKVARAGVKAIAAVYAAVDLWHVVNIF